MTTDLEKIAEVNRILERHLTELLPRPEEVERGTEEEKQEWDKWNDRDPFPFTRDVLISEGHDDSMISFNDWVEQQIEDFGTEDQYHGHKEDFDDLKEAVRFCLDAQGADNWEIRLRNELTRENLTQLALSLSLCPIHFCDYAICFDDQDPDCYAVRVIHPGHDT